MKLHIYNLNKLKDKVIIDLENRINIYKKNYFLELRVNNERYLINTSPKRIVIDFIAGMTDEFLKKEIERLKVGSDLLW